MASDRPAYLPSLLLLVVAGAGGPASHLAAQLLDELGVLQLHVLCELLAPVDSSAWWWFQAIAPVSVLPGGTQ